MVINERVKPVYESSGLLRVEPASLDLFDLGMNSEKFAPFLETQVQLISSASVLTAALTDDKVVRTTLVKESTDPENEIRERLQVSILEGTYLIRVGLTTLEPGDGPVIVNAIIKSYMYVANDWSDKKNAEQITRLKAYGSVLDGKVEECKATWFGLAEQRLSN